MSHFKTYVLVVMTIFVTSCSSSDPNASTSNLRPTQSITGRAEEGKRFAVYRAPLAPGWIRRDPLPEEMLEDTKKALCDFFIKEGNETVRIAIHNFPSNSIEDRIPPSAQIARWQQQLGQIDSAKAKMLPQAFSGYCGLLFCAQGKLEGTDTTVLGWSLQLGPEHYHTLADKEDLDPVKRALYRQMRADVTIKATGPPHLVEKHYEAIVTFARAFELIEEIPTSS